MTEDLITCSLGRFESYVTPVNIYKSRGNLWFVYCKFRQATEFEQNWYILKKTLQPENFLYNCRPQDSNPSEVCL